MIFKPRHFLLLIIPNRIIQQIPSWSEMNNFSLSPRIHY